MGVKLNIAMRSVRPNMPIKNLFLSGKREKKTGTIGGNQISWHIRKYLLRKTNYCCERCGWGEQNPFTLTIPLEIHHKDGDFTNNSENNLEVLCPNCHSLTENYRGAKTKGGGSCHWV